MAVDGWVSKAPRLRHVVPFDGIRGIGVIAVMLAHAVPMGSLSLAGFVDLFFVLSGALITTLLLQEHRDTGDVNVRKFYARRLFRLLPGLWLMLAGSAVVGVVLKLTDNMGARTLGGLAKEIVVSFFYLHNIVYPFNDGPWIDHLWTLGVEEQFYLIVGVVALVFIVRGRVRAVAWMLVALMLWIQVTRLALWPGPLGKVQAVMWNQRPDALMMGMLVAITSAHLSDEQLHRHRAVLGRVATVALAVFVFTLLAATGWMHALGWEHHYIPDGFQRLLETGERPDGFWWFQWGHTASVWSTGIVTFCMFRLQGWWPNALLGWKPLAFIGGALSYPLYLWHIPMQVLVHPFLPDGTPKLLWVLIAIVVPFIPAYPSWRYVETKALEFKDRFSVTGATRPARYRPTGASPATGTAAEAGGAEK